MTEGVYKLADGEEQSPWWKSPAAVGAGAAALSAPALYALARRRNLSNDPRLRAIQEAAGGKFTRIMSRQDPGSMLGRLWDRFRYAGGGNVIYRDATRAAQAAPAAPEKIQGALRHFSPLDHQHYQGSVNIGSNTGMDKLVGLGRDKWKEYEFFSKHAPGSMGRSENVGDILRSIGYKKLPADARGRARMLTDLQAHLKSNYGSGFVMKDIGGVQSSGAFPTDSHNLADLFKGYRRSGLAKREQEMLAGVQKTTDYGAMFEKLRADPNYSGRVLEGIFKDPRSAMVQERLPIQQNTGFRGAISKFFGGNPSKEFRVHVENGKVVPNLVMSRYDPLGNVLDRDLRHGAGGYAQQLVDRLPAKYRNATFGMDVAPLQGGGYRLIESNPSGRSGLLGYSPHVGSIMHKAYTGQHAPMVAGAMAGAGAAALGGGAAYAYNRGMNQQPQPQQSPPVRPPFPMQAPGQTPRIPQRPFQPRPTPPPQLD